MTPKEAQRGIRKLKKLFKKNVKIINKTLEEFDKEDSCYFSNESNRIYMINFTKPQRYLYSLLHELGHYIQKLNKENIFDQEELLHAYSKCDSKEYLTTSEKNAIISVEREAWDIGKLIGRLLKTELNGDYENLANENVLTYIKYIEKENTNET